MPKTKIVAPQQRTRKIKQHTPATLVISAINQKEYKYKLAGFAKAIKHYPAFNVLAQLDAPHIASTLILQIQFKQSGEYGLCLYNTATEQFEEEPAPYSSYRMTQTLVNIRFGFTHAENTAPKFEPYGVVTVLAPCGFVAVAKLHKVEDKRLLITFDYAELRIQLYFSPSTGKQLNRPTDAKYPRFKAILSTYKPF